MVEFFINHNSNKRAGLSSDVPVALIIIFILIFLGLAIFFSKVGDFKSLLGMG